MARPKEFDTDEALDAALRVFWRKGYEATSIQDLVEATQVNRASLYESFGSKRKLFDKALARFASSENNVAQATASMEPGLPRIRAAFQQVCEQSIADVRGCMVVNAIVERGAEDRKLRNLGRNARTGMENFFAASLAEAERLGQIRAGRDIPALACYLTNALFGLRVTAKTLAEPEAIRSIVQTTLSVIEN
jgi:TetR/AcrR family transcriptional repressor of nem operon